ncbi:hypothetical protein [Methylocella silvestris]|uniref:Uncharacterized protein n=1 Tax=Methylocella silvestris TaxID=199596 RepID=A0A2J7TG11_METSI|nr:hypothetical protein [Methylocella silvestris]PNG25700.1 hypothetical protein CR492_12335 [Methylocella silvestris]
MSKTQNPAALATRTGPEKVSLLGGWNSFENSPSASELQQQFFAARFRLAPVRAALIAALAFDGRPA